MLDVSARHNVALLAGMLCVAVAHAQQPRDAEPSTVAAQDIVRRSLPFTDRADFDDARAGFIATLPDATIDSGGPRPVWSMRPYAFLDGAEAPPTVNPSLWRQAQLNAIHGLFKVADGIYQVRGFDISNMTVVEGASGVIVIDPLLTTEAAHAALELYFQHRPRKPVAAVIYSHSHADHFGGVKGVTSDADVAAGRTHVYAPQGFMEHAVAENIIAGNAMSRRAQFQFGPLLPPGPRGQVDTGLGKNLSRGTLSLIAPTDSIERTMDTRTIDGVEIVFQLTPGTEAPAEMNMYFPRQRVLDMAENTTHNLHNLYTLRGAEVRDGRIWSRYISDALEAFGARTDVLIAQHHWPTRGTARVQAFLAKQRDLYKFVHDQAVRLLNQGYTPNEIAERLRLPSTLANEWYARDYYGTLSHNSKAVYQRYLGWYDANPAHLNELPPVESARKYVEYMGGAQAVLERAREDFKRGNYRWVASVLNQVVFADPSNREARLLAADALEQLGYQAEAGTWRNAYLYGAQELRNGVTKLPAINTLTADALKALPLDLFFDFLGVRLNGTRADGKHIVINWNFSDTKQRYVLNLENAALTYTADRQAPDADASVTLARATLDAITLRQTTFPEAVKAGSVQVVGDPGRLVELLGLLDNFEPMFEVVEPKPAR
ncbi:MAG TPA: alkyl sulfatase dimerization domain-containing protein [Burkholderiaceae bacterium]|nr:alkyl sulfatase dimerization domain-containing protein [Burkholderiaceae bacterium]